jgi:hypothetical protein
VLNHKRSHEFSEDKLDNKKIRRIPLNLVTPNLEINMRTDQFENMLKTGVFDNVKDLLTVIFGC